MVREPNEESQGESPKEGYHCERMIAQVRAEGDSTTRQSLRRREELQREIDGEAT